MTAMVTGFSDKYIHSKKFVRYKSGKDKIILTDALTAYWEGKRITVLPGYVTDGASIPRIAWRAVGNPWEEYQAAAVIHDILYESEVFTRADADQCFIDLMEWLEIGWLRRSTMYRAVRMGGGFTWRKHTDESKAYAKQFLLINNQPVE